MTEAERKRLQRMIDRTARTSAAYQRAQTDLNDWCLDRYGFEPGDRNVDSIIDAVFDGGGETAGMTADEFDEAMRNAAQ